MCIYWPSYYQFKSTSFQTSYSTRDIMDNTVSRTTFCRMWSAPNGCILYLSQSLPWALRLKILLHWTCLFILACVFHPHIVYAQNSRPCFLHSAESKSVFSSPFVVMEHFFSILYIQSRNTLFLPPKLRIGGLFNFSAREPASKLIIASTLTKVVSTNLYYNRNVGWPTYELQNGSMRTIRYCIFIHIFLF